jgi:ketosteroid isomerase-like protein
MGNHSQEEQALRKIQREWAEARVKRDSSYTRRIKAEDCTIVWPDGTIVNKRGDLESMTGDIVFSEFKIHNLQVRLYDDTGIVLGEGIIRAQKGKQDLLDGIRLDRHICETGRSVEGGRFANHSGLGKMIAYSYR